jgi:hypothetical protein
MAQPTKTINKKAKFGFCSFTIRAKKVATRAMPTICKISMAGNLL